MPFSRFALLSLCLVITANCTSVTKLQHEGSVQPDQFYHELQFNTYRSLMVIPMKVNGISRNFLFDTGAQLTLLQQDSVTGKSATITGASKRKVKMGHEMVDLFELGGIKFINTHAANSPLQSLKDSIPEFGGLIGQPIIEKANWLIDYTNQKLQISSTNLADDSFQSIEIRWKDGSPYTQLHIGGKSYKTIVDLGSSGEVTIPENSKLAKQLLATYLFNKIDKEGYTLGGWQMQKQYVATIPTIKLGEFEFTNVEVKIKHTSQRRVGIPLFKNHLLYIDNTAGNYKIKPLNKSNI